MNKPQDGNYKKMIVGFRITEDEKRRVALVAERLGIDMSDYIRDVLREALERDSTRLWAQYA